jgi:hypothetical protein
MDVSGQLHALAALPPGKSLQYPLDRRLSGFLSQLERDGEEKNISSMLEIESLSYGLQPITILTELPRRKRNDSTCSKAELFFVNKTFINPVANCYPPASTFLALPHSCLTSYRLIFSNQVNLDFNVHPTATGPTSPASGRRVTPFDAWTRKITRSR